MISFGGHPPWPFPFSLTPYSVVESKHDPLLFSSPSSLSSSGFGLLEPLSLSLSLSGSGLNQGFQILFRFQSYEFKQLKIYSDIPCFGGLSESVLLSSSGSGFGSFPESSSPAVPLSISGSGLLPLLELSSLALLSLLPAMRETDIIYH